jgi:hypothetical protein
LSRPWSLYVSRAASESAAVSGLTDHVVSRHRFEFVLRRVGVIDAAGRLRVNADGTVTFPPRYRGRRDWQ